MKRRTLVIVSGTSRDVVLLDELLNPFEVALRGEINEIERLLKHCGFFCVFSTRFA